MKYKKWMTPVGLLAFIAIFIFAAKNFADEPIVYAKGDIVLDPSLLDKAEGIRTLFIIVHNADSSMPMPHGAIRQVIPPISSTDISPLIVTPARLQTMIEGAPYPMNARLKVRLDRDGAAGPDQPGDLVGMIERVPAGSRGVVIKIDKLVE